MVDSNLTIQFFKQVVDAYYEIINMFNEEFKFGSSSDIVYFRGIRSAKVLQPDIRIEKY
ncbi:MAG: hypothetical protein KAW51_10100 [Candidatus Lokiarchaeota archaeon]|nr:hypothetical protein [Candidatus Lokiarchaeota archaeon]